MKLLHFNNTTDIPFGKHQFMANIPSLLGVEESERYYFKISSWFADKIDGNVDIDICSDELEAIVKRNFRAPEVPCYNGVLCGIYDNHFVLEVIRKEYSDSSNDWKWVTIYEEYSDIFESRVALTTELERYLDDELKSFSGYICNSGLWDEEADREKIISSVTTVVENIKRSY